MISTTTKKLLFIAILFIYQKTFAQQPPIYNDQVFKTNLFKKPVKDTSVVKKHFGRAAFELGLAEVIPWTYDRYVAQVDYAKISWKTVGHNIKPGSWSWDNDPFQTNQFGHPYHGSQFFNAFRTNGYSFWQSAQAAVVGSYLWETFAENQAPSPNDFVNTSFGGIVLGEMTYRLSNKIVNNNSRGFKRQVSEVMGFIVSPMNGLNRILDGKWGKVSGLAKRDSSKISAEFDIGLRKFNADESNLITSGRFGWYGHARFIYGTPYEDYDTPFSNITINAEFGQDDSTKVNVISVYGSLAGWEIKSTGRTQHLAILSANYDYIRNEAFFYGAQSVKMNLYSNYNISKKIKANTTLGAGPVILAAVPDPYLYKGRNYNYGPGFAINGGGGFNIANKFFYNFYYRGGWMKTLNGNESSYFLHTVSTEVSYAIVKDLLIAVEPGYFTLRGTYKDYPDVNRNYPYLRISTRYMVNL
ncbi:hypothetical protein GCM10023149_22430 [Mucilaginibacter gynuensis]|uniref:DUF3943 domain-containing protein n=1 Tax=Mucilaginibacter gynuensis TaxID=1302236 RepID=A0ABP8GDE0_9SPHI